MPLLPSLLLTALVPVGPAAQTPAVTAPAEGGTAMLLIATESVHAGGREELLTTRDAAGRRLHWSRVDGDLATWTARENIRYAARARATANDGWVVVPPTLVLRRLDRDAGLAAAQVALLAPDATIEPARSDALSGSVRFSVPARGEAEVLALAARLADAPGVAWVEPDWIVGGRSLSPAPNDPLFIDQWALENTGQTGGATGVDLKVLEAWDVTRGSSAASVLVIDVGVDLGHPDLLLGPAVDVTGDAGTGGPVNVCDSHGTWVAGCIAAIADNQIGLSGVAPESPVLSARALVADVPFGFCDGGWSSQASWTAEALLWGHRQGARVSVNSNAYGFTSKQIEAAYEDTLEAGMVHFAAAGNTAETELSYPASLPAVISVGAIDADGHAADFSSGGADLDLVAPGVQVATTDRVGEFGGSALGDYVTVDGTSFAAPMAAAVASLMLSAEPDLGPELVRFGLLATAGDLGSVGFDPSTGHGLVDARAALDFATGQTSVQLSDVSAVSVATGGVQRLVFDAPNASVGLPYLMLGSASGTEPGVPVEMAVLPLVPDAWFQWTLANPNTLPLEDSLGTLGRLARAEARVVLPAGLDQALIGLTLHHAFVALAPDGSLTVSSRATPLTVGP